MKPSAVPLPATIQPAGPVPLSTKVAYAQALAEADMLPQSYRHRPGNLLLAVEFAELLGVHPLAAVQHIHVIDGTLGMSAELMRALVRRRGHRIRLVDSTDTAATVQVITADDPDHVTEVTYTLDDARRAGLLDRWFERWTTTSSGRNRKETWMVPPDAPDVLDDVDLADAPDWVKALGPLELKRRDNWWRRPGVMLVARATSTAVRAACPEVMMGLDDWTPEPTDDDPDDVDPSPAGGELGARLLRIRELGGRLDHDGRAAAREFTDTHGYDLHHLDLDQADAIIAELERLTEPESEPVGVH